MSLVSEIKCPHCGHWHPSTGMADARCAACGDYLEPERLAHEKEMKIAESKKGNYYLEVKDSDETITQIFKIFVNSARWTAYYMVMLFFVIMAGILFIVGIVTI